MKYIIGILLISVCGAANADLIDCGYSKVGKLYAIGARTDGNANANRLQVSLSETCVDTTNKVLGFVSNDEASYEGILSLLLAAKMSDKPIRIVLDSSKTTSNSMRIEWVNFE